MCHRERRVRLTPRGSLAGGAFSPALAYVWTKLGGPQTPGSWVVRPGTHNQIIDSGRHYVRMRSSGKAKTKAELSWLAMLS